LSSERLQLAYQSNFSVVWRRRPLHGGHQILVWCYFWGVGRY
jgi:hypothetical protein